ncbi:MAG: M16 family metallopeptidase [Myxococcota bacterium]
MFALLLSLLTPTAQAVEVAHETYELDNGLQVILVPDQRLPKVVVDVWYDVGSYDDPQGRSGFAHLFEHLMFKGTDRVGEGDFDAFMEQAGGWNNATTGDERTNYFDVAPSSALELLLWLEADRMTALDVTQAKLDVEREVVRNEKRQNYEDRPYGAVWISLPPAMYPEANPLHRSGIGNHEELMAATLEDVTGFYETYYGPNNAVLTVAGDFETAKIKPLIKTLFGGLPRRDVPERVLQKMPTKPVKSTVDLTDDVTLPMVMYAYFGPAGFKPGDAERDVLAYVLAGSDDARLSRRLVHEERLVEDVSVSQYSGRWDSSFLVQIMASPTSDLDRIEAIVNEEIAALAADRPPTPQEVDRARASLEMSLLGGVETVLGKAEILQRYRMYTGRTDYLEADLARYATVTPDSAKAEASKLVPERRLRLRVLPEGGE